MNRAVFLDRDGVLIEEVEYLDSLDKIKIIPGAIEAVRLFNEADFKVIVISNQSGVARGYFPIEFVIQTHELLNQRFAVQGARIDQFYFCPHHPQGTVEEFAIECTCRKPGIGMLVRAQKDFQIDLKNSFLIGDKISDIQAAFTAGAIPVLVKTGYGLQTLSQNHTDLKFNQVQIARDILDAAQKIMKFF